MTLNAVVLPAPFGPISPTISPSAAVNDTRSSATTPPNRLVTFSTERSAIGGSTLKRSGSAQNCGEAREASAQARARGRGARARRLHPHGGGGRGSRRRRGRSDRQVARLQGPRRTARL